LQQKDGIKVSDCLPYLEKDTTTWLHVQGHPPEELMRVLTVIATIFIPLTFLVGIYGMNFDQTVSPWSMPELSWRYGYVALWGIMLGIAGVMLYLFRRRGWL